MTLKRAVGYAGRPGHGQGPGCMPGVARPGQALGHDPKTRARRGFGDAARANLGRSQVDLRAGPGRSHPICEPMLIKWSSLRLLLVEVQ